MLILPAALAAACGARAADPLAGASVVTHRDPRVRTLQRDLARLFASPAVERGLAAAVVQSIDRGEPLFRYNAHRLLIPASTLKLATVAVAADRLGWDYRFTTTLSATAPIDGGVLRGDLVVTGDGDPTISRRYGSREPLLASWADRLAAAGLRRIEGRLIGDDRAFGDAMWGDGWTWQDLQYGYGAAVDALQVGDATTPLLIVPGVPGRPASVSLMEPAALAVDSDVTTVDAGSTPSIQFERIPGQPRLRVTGHVAADAAPLVLYPAVPNPTDHFLEVLRQRLEAAGIAVRDGTADLDDAAAPPVPLVPPLLEHRSPALAEIAGVTLKDSHNLHAESLLRAIARTEQQAGSAEAGLRIVRRVLESWGVPPGAVRAADGSGLSRLNYVAPDALLVVLRRMATDPRHRDRWMSALPAGGSDGTLAARFVGGPAQGRVRAKTGSLSGVRALAGYVRTLDEETLAFVIIVNDAAAARGELEPVIDGVVDRLAAFRR